MMKAIVQITVFSSLLMLGACSSAVTGHVFVDSSNNGRVDVGEKGVENAHFSVTLDGEHFADGYTGANGDYVIRTKESGKYCVQIDKKAVSGSDTQHKARLSVAPLIADTPPESPPPPLPPKPAGKSVSAAKDIAPAPNPPKEPYGSSSSGTTAPQVGTMTVSSLSGCVQVGMGNQEMDVPVKLDYTVSIENVPAPEEIKVAPGDKVQLKLMWPNSCTLENVKIPDVLMTDDPDVGIVTDISPRLDFPEKVIPDSVASVTDLTQDALASKVLQLRMRSDVSGGKLQYTIQPKVLCPDTISYALPTQTITVTAKPLVSVSQNLKGVVGFGAVLTDEVTVVNNGSQTITAAKMTVSFSNMVSSVTATGGGDCNNLGNNISCPIDLAIGEKKVIKIGFTLPKKLDEKEEFTIHANVKLSSQDASFDADKINFWLQP